MNNNENVFTCLICNTKCNGLNGLNSHLKRHHISSQEYYDKYLKQENDGKCIYCGQPTRFTGILTGYNKVCKSKNCIGKSISNTKQNWTDQQRNQFLERQSTTNIEKYGTRCPANIDGGKKSKETKIKHFGENYQQYITAKAIKTKLSKYGTLAGDVWTKRKQNLDNFAIKNNCIPVIELIRKYGQGWLSLDIPRITYGKQNSFIENKYIDQIEKYSNTIHNSYSKGEKEVLSFIKSIYNGQIIENSKQIISPYELDIYLPDKKIAIEFNGIYWHSVKTGTPKDYHYTKSHMCEDLGIRLIHIYDSEWIIAQDKIKQFLSITLGHVDTKIYARKCEVKLITNKEAKLFNEITHLQGHRNAQVTYGLFYQNKLVQLMSFSKTRYNRNLKNDNEWEIIRGCPGSNNIVIGGVSKLFKHFIEDYKPSKIFSYCDFNKFDGKSYELLGMKCIGYTGPNKWWIINNELVPRSPSKYKQFKNNNYNIVWGSGSKKFIWEVSNENN